MKFRKLLLCLIAGIFMTAFANQYTYAAEEDTIVTEDTTITNSTIDNTTGTSETDETAVVSDNTGSTTEITNSTEENTTDAEAQKAAEEKAAAEKAAKVKAEKEKAAKEKAAAEKAAKEKAAAEKAAKEKAEKEKADAYSKADLRLLSALIFCEANGESYNGKLAVGIVVMNRTRSGSYPDSVKGVIYQKYQFGPVNNGSLANALEDYDNGNFTSDKEKDCIKAAEAALSGTTSITVNGSKKEFSKYLYFSGSLSGATYSLGNHEFK
jgi:N-acetylmuramoyl-L-alanine amidase